MRLMTFAALLFCCLVQSTLAQDAKVKPLKALLCWAVVVMITPRSRIC